MSSGADILEKGGISGVASTPATGQATLSAIGDLSIAAEQAVQEGVAVPRWTRWLSVWLFVILLYLATCFVLVSILKTNPYIEVFYAPLLPVSIAGLVFWRRQVWKSRSMAWQANSKAHRNRWNSLAHETANGANALRANITALREANPSLTGTEQIQQIERALARIVRALETSGQ